LVQLLEARTDFLESVEIVKEPLVGLLLRRRKRTAGSRVDDPLRPKLTQIPLKLFVQSEEIRPSRRLHSSAEYLSRPLLDRTLASLPDPTSSRNLVDDLLFIPWALEKRRVGPPFLDPPPVEANEGF